jgi:hypothetical protein
MQVATTNSVVTSSAMGAVAAGTSIVSPFTILVDRHPHTTIRHRVAETLPAAFANGFVNPVALWRNTLKTIPMAGRNRWGLRRDRRPR